MIDTKKMPFKILQGSLFLKIIVLAAIFLIVSVFLFGMPAEFGDIIWGALRIVVGLVLLVFIFKGIQSSLKPKPVSPTDNFKKKVIRVAKMSKPFNVKKLYLRGEDMRVYSFWGKIVGLCFIPYLSARTKYDSTGHILYRQKLDKRGKPIYDADKKPVMVPEHELLNEKDGDWLFVTRTSPLPFLGKEELVRAHHSLCSEMGESVWIKTVNLVPIGDYLYPTQQWQQDITRIQVQHQVEVLIEVYYSFLDLLAHVTQMSLGSDPTLQKIMIAQSEAITAANRGVLVGGSSGGG